jgi:hypothetical protein
MRASQVVIDVDPASGRVTGLNGYGAAPSGAELLALSIKMQGVAHAIQNGFYMAQGRLAVLRATSAAPPMQAIELVKGLFKSMTGITLPGPTVAAPAEVIKNVENALTTLERGFKERVVPAIERVKTGELEPDRWFKMAAPYADGIVSILNEVNESGGAVLVSDAINGMIADAKRLGIKGSEAFDQGKDAFGKMLPYLPWLIGGFAILYAFNTLRVFMPFRGLSGYTPKRRSRRRLKR